MILRRPDRRSRLVWALAGVAVALDCNAGQFVKTCQSELKLGKSDCVKLERIALPERLPAMRGNEFADSDEAARIGFEAFFDPNFSYNRKISCATCHSPEHSYTDQRKTSVGKNTTIRNAPTLLNAARHSVLFWDGRATSLASQPLFALENEDEMDFSRLELVQVLHTGYKQRYERLFGPLPDPSLLPKRGKPGDPEFDRLPEETKRAVNQVATNFGKMMAAFVRKLAAGPSEIDKYIQGQSYQLFPQAKNGMAVFVRKGCIECHSGPILSDEKFRKMESLSTQGPPDLGAAAKGPAFSGTFRTPSLRNVSNSGPYGHNGEWADLQAAIQGHPLSAPLTKGEENDLTLFLMSLAGKFPPRPWSGWPNLH